MEEEGEKYMRNIFEMEWSEMGCTITDDEEDNGDTENNENEKPNEIGDGQSTPKETTDPNYLLENFKKEPDNVFDEDEPLRIGQPESNNDFQFFDDQGCLIVAAAKMKNSGMSTSFGMNLGKESGSNTSIHSQLSVDSTTPRCSARKKCSLATVRTPVRQMTAETVQILSDPQLLKAIEVFQGSRMPEEGDIVMLSNPRVLQALCEFNRVEIVPEEENQKSFPEGMFSNVTSTPDGRAIPLISPSRMKKEGQKRMSRKWLSDFDMFNQVWSSTPKRRRGGKMSETQQVQINMSSPDHGKRATKDASTDELLRIQSTKVQRMKQLDRLLKRNPTSTKSCMRQIYNQVN